MEVGSTGTGSQYAGSNVALYIDTAGVTVGRSLNINNSNVEALGTKTTVGGTNTAGVATFSGGITLKRGVTLSAASGGQVDFTGILNDGASSFSVKKEGAGIVKLTNANTYDGGTTVSAGTLLVTNTTGSATGTGAVNINLGATLTGTGILAGATTIASGATLAPGDGGIGALTFNGTLSLAGTNSFEIQASDLSRDQATGISTLTYGGTLQIANLAGTLGELFALKWCNVYLDRGVLQVRHTLIECGGQLILSEPKTDRSRRSVELPQIAVDALREHRKQTEAEGLGDSPWVFCNFHGGPLRRTHFHADVFKPMLMAMDLPPIRFHDLRHNAACRIMPTRF